MNEMFQFFKQISGKLNLNIYAGIQGQSTPQQMAFIRNLQKEMRQKNTLDSPLNDLKVVVFDIETTGFYPEKGDYVLSIGAIKMKGPKIETGETFYSLIKSEQSLSAEIAALTNLSEEELQKAPPAAEVLMQFFKFVDGAILVAHHANHEQTFMKKITWDILRTKFNQRIIDTSFLIRLSDPYLKSMPLEEVCCICGIQIKDRHNALGDAAMTAQVWRYYLEIAQKKGFSNLTEVYEYLAKLE
ncbi:exonuclease domain-containing protein [Paenibacillus sp. BSR1-1]|uniref:exonuclease domain-containing protein n=1 Tax=Paenibacillus sp. BSR1-1 TaxID=3020845 RepID=UPI0025B0DD2B|nr:exonuclease domain-containing protein [Paenibacillus sp. BSR1-1]MDN3017475.1 exonuclease domain-containing protein [Paenibacillus sp. BSR1-1]